MDVAIPPEFEAYAREQVEAGASASTEEVVATALRDHLARMADLKAEIAKGLASLDHGSGVDALAAMDALIAAFEPRPGP